MGLSVLEVINGDEQTYRQSKRLRPPNTGNKEQDIKKALLIEDGAILQGLHRLT